MRPTGSRKQRLLYFSVSIVVALILLSLWLRGTRQNGVAPEGGDLIRVAQWGQERYLIYLPLYVAIEEGYFAREGLTVNVSFTGNDDQTFAAVAGGSADFGIGDPAFAAISRSKGFPALVIGTVVGGVAIWGVTNRDELKVLGQPEDLSGLRVGTFPAPSTNYTLMRELVDSLPAEVVKPDIVQAAIGAQIALLESGSADIAMVLEPAASIAESEGYRVVYSSPAFHGSFAFTGVTTTEDVVRQKRDETIRFVAALERAIHDCRRRPEIAERVARKIFPSLPPEVLKRAIRRMMDEKTFPESITVDSVGWRRALDARVKVGDLEPSAEVMTTVDNSFAIEALKLLEARD